MARPKNSTCPVCQRRAHPDGIRHLVTTRQAVKKPGRYQARYLGPDHRSYAKTFLTVNDAKAWLAKQHADISSGRWTSTGVKSSTTVQFNQYGARWLKNRRVKGRPLAGRTLEGYQDLLDRFILPTFATKPIHQIDRDDVRDWYNSLPDDRPTYRAKAYGLLRTILASAVEDECLAQNPAHIRGAGQVDRAHQVRPATLEELVTLTEAMPPRYRLMVQLATWCALRFGELTELRRADVDTKEGVLRVRRGVVLIGGAFEVKAPKSAAGVRDVAIPAALLPMVAEHLLQHTAPGPTGLLFPSRNHPAEHLRQSSLARVYYPAREKAGRPDLRFHDLRHTGAVLAAQAGATIAELMGRLGHSTSQAALRYQHAGQGRDAVIASRLSAMIEGRN